MSIGLFVDGSYMYKTFEGQLDYLKLRQLLEEELSDAVDEAYYFNSDDDPPKATDFNRKLAVPAPYGPGFCTKIYWVSKKKLFWPADKGGHAVLHPTLPGVQFELKRQKGVDVGLAHNMVRSYYKRQWKKLVLCAGDADFHEPVQDLVESENVDLFLVGSLRGISSRLRRYARRIFQVDREPLASRIRK